MTQESQPQESRTQETTPSPVPTSPDNSRPDWLPQNFEHPEQLVEAYNSLQSNQLAPLNEEIFNTLAEDYFREGSVNEAHLKTLEKVGISSPMVDTYLNGLKLQADQLKSKVFDAVGGEGEYKALMNWGQKNLSEEQRTAYEHTLGTGDLNLIMLAAKGLHAEYRKSQEPKLMGGKPSMQDMGVFRSKAEMTAAIRDPRYEKDPAYRRDVSDKLSRSSL